MSTSQFLSKRSDSPAGMTGTERLMVALIVLVSVGFAVGGALYLFRRIRKSRTRSLLPFHRSGRHRSITVTAIPINGKHGSYSIYSEKEELMSSLPSSPTSPVPEIRITFPEEEGPDGKRKSGRVVIVQVGEAGAAFVRDVEPENLPPYQKSKGAFESVDLNRVGGLKDMNNCI